MRNYTKKVLFISYGAKMNKISNFFRAFNDVIRVIRLGNVDNQVAFYSEGESHWPHLENIVSSILNDSKLSISYLTSSKSDPGFKFKHPKFKCFYIGNGVLRDFLFQTLNSKVVVLTMPDLNQFSVKRSRYETHYIYVQHSLVSLHMIYRDRAFNHYDTICCSGPHHIREIRAIEKIYNLPRKKILEHGYSRLDSLIKVNTYSEINKKRDKGFKIKKILIAPSWGPSCIIESNLCLRLINDLLHADYEVILRPHQETMRKSEDKIQDILKIYNKNNNFRLDLEVSNHSSFSESDVMISDWSGAALEYSFAFLKPVIFCDLPKKINNPNYKYVEIEPFEIKIRQEIGTLWDCNTPINEKIQSCNKIAKEELLNIRNKYLFNIGLSDSILKDYILENFYAVD